MWSRVRSKAPLIERRIEGDLMKISIITPTFEAARCITGCIESVAEQTFSDFEHIIMDGDSHDGTTELVAQACKRYPHLKLFSEKDQGIYDAMNKGLLHADGDYIIFLGADDQFFNAHILDSVFRKVGDERPDVIYGSVLAVGNGMTGVADGSIYGGEFDLPMLLHKNICHQAIFYSRSIITKAGTYNTRYRYFADWDYNLRCYSLGKFRYVDEVISRYNTSGRSANGLDVAFYASFFEEVRGYFGLSIFNRHYRDLAGYIGLSGKLRMREMRDPRGLIYLVAACWHSPRYFFELLNTVVDKITGRRRKPAQVG
jgi:glycosyltransferase involved in cell wall biosynthesis